MLTAILQYINITKSDATFMCRLRFCLRTLLLFLVASSFFKSEPIDYLVSHDLFKNSSVLCWFSDNETLIFNIETIYLNFQFFVFILLLIAQKTKIYANELLSLFEQLIYIQIYVLLFMQLFANLHITQVSIDDMFCIYMPGSILNYPSFTSFCLNLFFIGMMVVGYFYQKDDDI